MTDELERLRAAAQTVLDRSHREMNTWRPSEEPPGYSRSWRDGFITCLSTISLEMRRALDPELMAKRDEDSQIASWGTDQEWFDRTGNCGHCGNVAEDCVCTVDDPCQCGPHPDARTWPRPCGWCEGTGIVEPVRRRA